MGNLQLTAFCIRQLAELSGAVGQNPMQQAIVHTFLKNYDQVSFMLHSALSFDTFNYFLENTDVFCL
jgi:hypothetical protein